MAKHFLDYISVSEKGDLAARSDHLDPCGEAMTGAVAARATEQVSARGSFTGNAFEAR